LQHAAPDGVDFLPQDGAVPMIAALASNAQKIPTEIRYISMRWRF
jgi:hypothetical protein